MRGPVFTQSIGIIGGGGLQRLAPLQVTEEIVLETPWGPPSAPLQRGVLAGREVFFLARHGAERAIPPHLVNYRANIAALATVGVRRIFACNTVGGLRPAFKPGSLVVPHQLIDYTWGRAASYWDDADQPPMHIDFTQPYDREARTCLIQAAAEAGLEVFPWGIYGVTQGPRLESAAEIRRLRGDGCDLVGMTGMPEAALAREKGLGYACLAVVVNPAAGTSAAGIDLRTVTATGAAASVDVVRLLAHAVTAAY